MLNYDMVGSPNPGWFVYDGDASDTASTGSAGSGVVEDVFVDFFTSIGRETEPTAFDGRSDYDAFVAAGIPAGGLFTGAEDLMTAEQAAKWEGEAGVAFDRCYHAACDTYDNVDLVALDEMTDAIAHGILTFAMTKSAVQGTDRANENAGSTPEGDARPPVTADRGGGGRAAPTPIRHLRRGGTRLGGSCERVTGIEPAWPAWKACISQRHLGWSAAQSGR